MFRFMFLLRSRGSLNGAKSNPVGNAGTGKSWFQVYALKQLLDDVERKFDIVIRQVKSKVAVFDLAEARAYKTLKIFRQQ